jgi:hypothetical protein
MKRRLFAGIPVFIMVALLAAGCGGSDGSEQNEDADTDAADDSPAEVEELVERGLSISAPAEGALLSGNFTVTFTWSELPDRITVMLDSDVIGTLTAEPMQLDVDSTGHGDGPHTLTATGAWGDDEVEAGPVSVIVDNEGPVIDASAYLTYAIVSGEQALIPVDIIDAAGLARIEIFRGTEPLTTVTADPFLPAFDSTAFDDSVLAMMLRVTDLSGRSVVSDEIPVTVMNRGSIVESLEATDPGSEWDTWSIDIPAEPTDVDDRVLHRRGRLPAQRNRAAGRLRKPRGPHHNLRGDQPGRGDLRGGRHVVCAHGTGQSHVAPGRDLHLPQHDHPDSGRVIKFPGDSSGRA